MDGAWRRPPKSLADYGHTELKRGAEWWGKSLLLTFGLLSKVSRCQSGTLSGRYRRNGYTPGITVSTVRPSSQASQLPHLDRVASARSALSGRHGSRFTRHRVSVVLKLCRYLWLSQASPHTFLIYVQFRTSLKGMKLTRSPRASVFPSITSTKPSAHAALRSTPELWLR